VITTRNDVLIAPIYSEFKRALTGLRKYNPNKIYVLHCDDNDSKYFKDKFIEKVKGIWNNLTELIIDLTSIEECTKTLNEIIIKEKNSNENTMFFVNTSTAPHVFSIATLYVAGAHYESVRPFYAEPQNT